MTKAKVDKARDPLRGANMKEDGGTQLARPAAVPLEVKMVLRKDIRRDEDQPRKMFDEGKLQDLAESIRAVGIRTPLQVEWVTGLKLNEPDLVSKAWSVVQGLKVLFCSEKEAEAREFIAARPGGFYRLVDGERRWRAAELAEVERVPVMVVDTSAPEWPQQKLAIQVVLNQQHENLSALEEAAAYRKEIEAGRHTAESLYKALGVSRAHLFGRLALNRLKPFVRKAVEDGSLSVSVAGLIAMVPGEATQKELMEKGMPDGWGRAYSFRQVKELIEKEYIRQLKNGPFDPKKLYAGKGKFECATCEACPRRSGNMADEFPELAKRPNVCTNVACFEAKWEAEVEERLEAAKRKGQPVIDQASANGLGLFGDYGDHDLRHGKGYVDLSRRCEPLGWDFNNNWRAALKKAFDGKTPPEVTLAVAPNGELRELVREETATKLLWECGHKKQANSHSSGNAGGGDQAWRKWKKKEKQMEKAAWAATATVLAKLVDVTLDAKLWLLVARAAYNQTSIEQHAYAAKRRGMTKVQTDAREQLEKWFKANEGNGPELARMTVELLVCAYWNGGSNYGGGPKWDKEFVELCGRAKVDPAKLHEELAAEKEKGNSKSEIANLKGEKVKVGEHKWTKTDLVSGVNSNYKCELCGVKSVRYGLAWPPKIKGKRDLKKFGTCPGKK